ncbi:MAG: T9SS type A sorting domain-containing protein [Flavobacteriales bacterium]
MGAVLALAGNHLVAQTTIISPTGDGGFEAGSTFAANNWTVVNTATTNGSQWFTTTATVTNGSYSFVPTGSRAAYISNNAGVNWRYNTSGASSASHLYQNVTFPVGEPGAVLNFRWNASGEATNWDVLYVYLCPTTLTPLANSPSGSSTSPIWSGTGTATLLGTFYQLAAGTGQSATVSIPSSLTNNCASANTMRLVFTWKNDASGGTEPPAAIDDISLVTNAAPRILASGGTYTINNAGSNTGTNFTSFTAAITDLNSRFSCSGAFTGPVTINVSAGQTFNENAPVILATGTAVNTITFQRNGAGANPKITPTGTAGSADFGLSLQGSDYFTFDGIDIDASAVTAVEYGYYIRNASATDGATNNTVKNSSITMNRANTSSRGIYTYTFSTPTNATGANSNNTYQDLTIKNVYSGIQLSASTATYPDLNTQIKTAACGNYNVIGDPSTANDIGNGSTAPYGIRATNQSGTVIRNTQVRNVTNTGGQADGIYLEGFIGTCEVSGNFVQTVTNASTSSTTAISGIRATHNTTGTNTVRIFNNSISEIKSAYTGSATSTRAVKALFLAGTSGSSTQSYDVQNNSVSVDGSSNPNISNTCLEFATSSGPVFTVKNNIFANFTAAQGATARHYGVYHTAGATIGSSGTSVAYNDIYIANDAGTSGFTAIGSSTNYNGTTAWQAAVAQATNNLSVAPGFNNNNSNLRTSASGLNNVGTTPAVYVTIDLDCAARTDNDLGAFNVSPVSLDMSAISLVAPGTAGCYGAAETVTISIKNNGTSTIDFGVNNTTVTTNVTGVATATLSAVLTSGTLAVGASQNVTMGTTLDMSASGTYTFNANTSVVGDGNPGNNAMSAASRTVIAPVAVPYLQDFSAGTFPANWINGTTWSVATGHGQTNSGLYKNLYSSVTTAQFTMVKLGSISSSTNLKFDYRIVDFTSYPTTATPNSPAWGNIQVQVSTDCGNSFSLFQTIDNTNHSSSLAWATKTYSLAAYVGQQVTFRFIANWTSGDWYADFDNFDISTPAAIDMGATALVTPVATGCYTGTETVTVRVQNLGASTIDFGVNPMTVNTNVSGAVTAALSSTVNSGTLAPAATLDVPMSATLNMSAGGTYTFNASTSVTGDGNATNDAMSASSRTVVAPVAVPYTQDFGTGSTFPANWVNGNSWSVGTTHGQTGSGLYKNIYGSAPIGQFTMVKLGPLAGTENFSFDYRLVNYSGYPATALPNSPAWGNITVEISTNCGVSYGPFDLIDASNHVAATAWATKTYAMASYAGQQVILRFTTNWTSGDWYADFDNFNVAVACSGTPSAGTTSTTTASFCVGGSASLSNNGVNTGSGISYQWKVSITSGSGYANVSGGTGAATQSYTSAALTAGDYYYVLATTCSGSATTVESNEVHVTVNAIPTPSITSDGPLSFCSGGSVNLSATAGDSYLWTPGSASTQTLNVTAAGNYTVAVTTNGCTGTSAATAVSVVPAPTGVTANSSLAIACPGSVLDLTSTGSTTYEPIVFSENFESIGLPTGWSEVNSSTGGSTPTAVAWAVRPNGYNTAGSWNATLNSNDASQFALTNADAGGSGITGLTFLSSPVMDLSGLTSANLRFYQYYRDNGTSDTARVQVSINGGTTWTDALVQIATVGTTTAFAVTNVSLNAYAGQAAVQLRFRYRAAWDYGWAIDNVSVSGATTPTFSWTSSPAGFTSSLQNPTGVTVVSAPVTYTVTASAGGCSTSAAVTVNPAGNQAVLRFNTDANASQISWEIKDAANATVASGSPVGNNTQVDQTVCLSNANGDCYTLKMMDSFGDGITGGGWELRTTDGKTILKDSFSGGSVSPASPTLTPAYGSGHPFCLPLGPATLQSTECGLFNNTLNNRIYANVMTGATQYEFQFLDPDAGYVRSIIKPSASMLFIDMGGSVNPLVPGIHYFVRIRTNAGGPLASAKYGPGCEMGMSAAAVVHCTQLINGTLYGHSCNETRAFGSPSYSFIYATPVLGASAYTFHIYIAGEPTLFDTTITRGTYVLQLKWPGGTPLTNGSTYNVDVKATVNGVTSNYCTPFCTITIDNTYTGMGGELTQVDGSFNGDVQMWPNPVADGRVNLALTGLVDTDQQIQLDLYDMYGRKVLARDYGNNGNSFSTVLELPSEVTSGVYLVHITVNGVTTVQRLSVVR